MNKENILKLADTIDKCNTVACGEEDDEYYQFSMENYWFDCGTPACISGWADELFGDSRTSLGITGGQAHQLFEPRNYYADFRRQPGQEGHITARHAAAVLRNLVETGVVDWSVGAKNA